MGQQLEIKLTQPDCKILVGGDAHYWPTKGKGSPGHRMFCRMIETDNYDLIVVNGDAFDADGISTHPAKSWAPKPELAAQLKETKKRMAEIRDKANAISFGINGPTLVYLLGNHEARFDKFLANKAGKFKGIEGFSLEEHFPDWNVGERLTITGKEKLVIKHQYKGGINPLKSNLQGAGCHIVTGHLHSQGVYAHTDYSGTKYAVDHGMLADPKGPQFSYGDSNPVNWRVGCVHLEFKGGKLMPPNLATVVENKAGKEKFWFNGFLHSL